LLDRWTVQVRVTLDPTQYRAHSPLGLGLYMPTVTPRTVSFFQMAEQAMPSGSEDLITALIALNVLTDIVMSAYLTVVIARGLLTDTMTMPSNWLSDRRQDRSRLDAATT
jgi:hypothetical protein